MRRAQPEDYPLSFRGETTQLEKAVGYEFRDKTHLYIALTHSSYANEKNPPRILTSQHSQKFVKPYFECNERYEFLGDSMLAISVTKYLFKLLEDCPEGDLTRLRAASVCEDALFEYASGFELGKYLLLGHGEERSDGRNRKSITADACEALIAAVMLDGGEQAAEKFVIDLAYERINRLVSGASLKDYKSLLQQIVQESPGDTLEYRLVGEEGPDHDKTFTTEVYLNSNLYGKGKGRSKRESEQAAARAALEFFGES